MSRKQPKNKTNGRVQPRPKRKQTYEEICAERDDLKRQLERAQMWEAAFAGGVRQDMNSQIEAIQVQRDELKQEVEEIYSVLVDAYHISQDEARAVFNRLQEQMKELEAVQQRQGLPTLVRGLWDIYTELFVPEMNNRWEIIQQQKQAARQGDISAFVADLNSMRALSQQAAEQRMATLLLAMMYGRSHDVTWICDEIMRELVAWGECKLLTLQLLDGNWREANLPKNPSKLSTLQAGLSQYQQFLNSGKNKNQWPVSETELTKYEAWYKTIKATADGTARTRLVGENPKD
jgi:hypothetical protein